MHEKLLEQLLLAVKAGEKGIDDALKELKNLPFEDLGYAKIDYHRQLRRGFPEVIYGEGKSPEQIKTIINKLSDVSSGSVLATRISRDVYESIKEGIPAIKYYPEARMLVLGKGESIKKGCITILSAGTSDMPVAEEAAITAEAMGNNVVRIYDVGVAGIHRLLAHKEQLDRARVLIVVAGMEGALASVVSGLVNKPVIAVPTSVGYGTSFNGLAALLAMLNSCSSGITVVNIDNGFGAAYAASLINDTKLE